MAQKIWKCAAVVALSCGAFFAVTNVGADDSPVVAQGAAGEAGAEMDWVVTGPVSHLVASRRQEFRVNFKRYDGEAMFAEVAENGAVMSMGDTLFEIEATAAADVTLAANEELVAAELTFAHAELDYETRVSERASRLERVEREFDHAMADLEYWEKYGKADELKRAEMSLQGHVDGIADQEDELKQLRELYKGNELAGESQRIVLERAERRLQRSKESYEIAKHVNEWTLGQSIPRTDFEKRDAVRRASERFNRAEKEEDAQIGLKRVALSKARNALEAARRKSEELTGDVLLVQSAPFTGLFVHGALKDNNGATPLFSAGDRVGKGTLVGTLLDVDVLDITVSIPVERLQAYLTAPEHRVSVWVGTTQLTAPAEVASVSSLVVSGHVSVRFQVVNDNRALMHGSQAKLEYLGPKQK